MVDWLFRACEHQFLNLRCMSLECVAIGELALDTISGLTKLEVLELKNCPVLPFLDPRPVEAQSLAKFTVWSDAERFHLRSKLGKYQDSITHWLDVQGQPRLSFAEQCIAVFLTASRPSAPASR